MAVGAAAMAVAWLALAGPRAALGKRAQARAPVARGLTGMGGQIEAARRTRNALADKLDAREVELRNRVRALYKLTRGGLLPLWVDADARADLARRRGAARRMILRDLAERKLLRDELDGAERDLGRLAAAHAVAPPVGRRALARPVPGRIVAEHGLYTDGTTRARLFRRGVELLAGPGQEARACRAGRVAWAGPVRELGTAVVLSHEDGLSTVVGGLSSARVRRGQVVATGAPLGPVSGERVYLEVRVGDRAIDPAPLLGDAR